MRRHNAFTLVELLVVIAILGILVALLLPAVQAARESSRRSSCLSNIRQMALAVQNFQSVKKHLPGVGINQQSQWAFSVQAKLLPYLEDQSLHDLIDFDQALMLGSGGSQAINPIHFRPAATIVPLFLCPSDGQPPISQGNGADWAGGNYVVNAGTGLPTYGFTSPLDGLFWYASNVRLQQVTDGLSKTLLISEAVIGNGVTVMGNAPTDVHRQHASYGGTQGPLSDSYCAAATRWAGTRATAWIWGREFNTAFNTYQSPNGLMLDCGLSGAGWYAARSLHPGGVNVALADGSARFVTDNIELSVWRGLSTRSGGESVNLH